MSRLRANKSGNVMAIMAAAIIPIAALSGSAVDAARLYFVKVRLQQACDAGALAGRKFMTDTNYTTTADTNAHTFFSNNFKTGVFGTASTGPSSTFTKTTDNQVHGDASVVVPMTLMKMFGVGDTTIRVSCEAKLEIPNLDVMFVLDTTGSMGETNPGDSSSKIVGLRTAVGNFYDTLEAAKVGTSQIRYGFVPYSSTVNVGMLLKREWVVDSWKYQSREPADQTTKTSTSTQPKTITTYGAWQFISGTKDTYISYLPPENCVAPANTQSSPSTYTTYTTNPDGSKTRTATQTINGSSYSVSLSNGVCKLTETRYTNYKQSRTETVSDNPNAGQTTTTETPVYWWNYKQVTQDVSSLKGSLGTGLMAGGSFSVMTAGGGGSPWGPRTITWPGTTGACIEERDTVRTNTYTPIPGGAYDMDVDTVPTAGDATTQWRPAIPLMVYARSNGSYGNPSVSTGAWPVDADKTIRYDGNYVNLSSYPNDYAACPSAAKKLGAITKSALTTYMNGLKVAGRTYHDIGFVWGVRLLSAQGLFASENNSAPNGSPIARHIIFMTDGQTETNFADYDAYGLAALDRRRTDRSRLPAGDAEQDDIVEKRLTALCQVAQRKNMTVWVIAFGTTLTPLLEGCATPGGHAFQANNATDLNNAFATIASNIAKLRVSR